MLKFSKNDHKGWGLIKGRINLNNIGNTIVALLGEKLGTTEEMYVNKIRTPPK